MKTINLKKLLVLGAIALSTAVTSSAQIWGTVTSARIANGTEYTPDRVAAYIEGTNLQGGFCMIYRAFPNGDGRFELDLRGIADFYGDETRAQLREDYYGTMERGWWIGGIVAGTDEWYMFDVYNSAGNLVSSWIGKRVTLPYQNYTYSMPMTQYVWAPES